MFAVVQVFDDYGHIGRNDVECRKTFTDADEANAYIDACKAKEDSAIWDVIDYNKKYTRLVYTRLLSPPQGRDLELRPHSGLGVVAASSTAATKAAPPSRSTSTTRRSA